jgi:AbrB family transcriptional regulator (stage V sporulation protein T)
LPRKSAIVTEGDLMGCVMLLTEEGGKAPDESEQKLAQTLAGFLSRQMES